MRALIKLNKSFWKKIIFIMLIILFDIEKSNGCRCHNIIVFLCISITFMNCCGLTHASEKPSLSIISTNESLTEYQQNNQTRTKIQASATTSSQSQNQIKPTLSTLDRTYEHGMYIHLTSNRNSKQQQKKIQSRIVLHQIYHALVVVSAAEIGWCMVLISILN